MFDFIARYPKLFPDHVRSAAFREQFMRDIPDVVAAAAGSGTFYMETRTSSRSHTGTPTSTTAGSIATRKASRSEEHTSELQSLMRISYSVLCFYKKKTSAQVTTPRTQT